MILLHCGLNITLRLPRYLFSIGAFRRPQNQSSFPCQLKHSCSLMVCRDCTNLGGMADIFRDERFFSVWEVGRGSYFGVRWTRRIADSMGEMSHLLRPEHLSPHAWRSVLIEHADSWTEPFLFALVYWICFLELPGPCPRITILKLETHSFLSQFKTLDWHKPPQPISKAKLATEISKSVSKFCEVVKATHGSVNIDFDRLILMSFRQASKSSWQPVFTVI